MHQPGCVCKTITAFLFAYLLRKNQALQSVVYCLSGTCTVREMKSEHRKRCEKVLPRQFYAISLSPSYGTSGLRL